MQILRNALRLPMRTIASNAGAEGAVVVEKVLEKAEQGWGYDAAKDTYGNMFTAGIVDPTKVVRCCLVDAASVASLLTTTETSIVDLPNADPPAGGGMGGMGCMGGMGGMM